MEVRPFYFILIFICIFTTSCNHKNRASVESSTLLIFGENKLINVNLDNNTIKWIYDATSKGNENKNYLTVSDSIVYVPFEDGDIIAFNINNGHKHWGYNLKNYAEYTNNFSSDSSMYTDDGDESYFHSLILKTQPSIADNKLILLSGSLNSLFTGKAFALNKENGKVEWISPLPYPYNSFAPLHVNNYLYINSSTDVVQIDLKTGSNHDKDDLPLATYRFDNPIYNQMYYEDNQLFLADEEGLLFCIDLTKENNGLENIFKWKSTLVKNSLVHISPNKVIFDENDIYLAANIYTDKKIPDLYFFKINKTTGQVDKKSKMPVESSITDFIDIGSNIIANKFFDILFLNKNTLDIDSTLTLPENMRALSNLEKVDDNILIFLTYKGVVKLNLENKELNLIELPFRFEDSYHFQNINSILFLKKSR